MSESAKPLQEENGRLRGAGKSARVVSIVGTMRGTMDAPLWLANHLPGLLPSAIAGRVRPRLFRLIGMSVGAGAFLPATIRFNPGQDIRRKVRFGARCFVNVEVFIDASAPVTIGDGVSVGHHVRIVTASHEIGTSEFRAGPLCPSPVRIETGAWIAAGATLLPGVTVGGGAIVAAGAVVSREVPPDTLVGGVPAKVIRKL